MQSDLMTGTGAAPSKQILRVNQFEAVNRLMHRIVDCLPMMCFFVLSSDFNPIENCASFSAYSSAFSCQCRCLCVNRDWRSRLKRNILCLVDETKDLVTRVGKNF